MARSSYGVIAFRVPHPENMSPDDLVAEMEQMTRELVDTIKSYGGELSTVGEVYRQGASDRDRVKESTVKDVVEKPVDGGDNSDGDF